MTTLVKPPDEARRLAALHALRILDTAPEARFDRITRLAQRLFDTPMAMVTLIDADRHWLKSEVGVGQKEGPREESFCAQAILDPTGPLLVEDARDDPRFAAFPSVLGDPGVRFYAGQPVAAPGGEPLGTLCVVDDKPRRREEFDTEALGELAAMVEAEIASLELAIGDELTGLSNRRGFELLGECLIEVAGRLEMPISAIYADLDNMKPINDSFGHEVGDRALVQTGAVLADSLRGSDLIARLGGDEFCALLVGKAATVAPSLVARVQEQVEARNAVSEEPFELSLSLGIGEARTGAAVDLWGVVALADAEMFAAKRAKKVGRETSSVAAEPAPAERLG